MKRKTHPFEGARKMKPTQKHRAAMWEGMLGTVYARNAEGKVKYFDYDWAGAREFAGVEVEGADPRLARFDGMTRVAPEGYGPRRGQWVLFVRREAK